MPTPGRNDDENQAPAFILGDHGRGLANCEVILQAGGASLDDVIEVGILLTNPADFAGLNEEYARWFPSGPPTRYVAKLGVELPGLLVSIRMTAFIT